jgi:hypothetical protein
VWPKIDSGEPNHYICTLREPIDEEFVLQNFGSGRYLLIVKDAQRKLIRKHTFSVHNQRFPPRVDEAEVLRVPENDVFFQVWAQKPNAGGARSEKEETKKEDIAGILRAHSEGSKLDPQVVSWLQDMANHRDDLAAKLAEASAKNPTADLANLITAVKLLMPAQAPPPSDKPELFAIIAAIRDMQPQPADPLAMLKSAKELFALGDRPARDHDEIDRLDRVLGFAQKLAALPVRNSGDQSGWDVGLSYVRELISPISQLANTWMLTRKGANVPPGAFPAAAKPAAPAAFDPYANPEAMRQHARAMTPQPAPAAAAAPAPQNANPSVPAVAALDGANPQTAPMSDGLSPLLQNYGGLVLNALNGGMPGYDFADHLAQLFGIATHAAIASQGEDGLTQALLAVPEFAVFGEARLRKFAHEFIEFETILEREEQEQAVGNG